MKFKKLVSSILVGVLALTVVGCGTKGEESAKDDKKIVVGATADPHAKILEVVKPLLEKEGYELEIKVFDDYPIINTALYEKELDANFFQHVPYLESTNKEKNYDLTYTAKVHIEPMGLYSDKITDIKDLKDGAEIAIPNDASNGSRALKLLADNEIIQVPDKEILTKNDILANPKNIKITEAEAAQLPRVLQDVDGAVINTNFALLADLNPLKNALVVESKDSPYANVLAVRNGEENTEKIKALTTAITSPEVKQYIEDTYKGAIIPAF